MHFQSQIFWKQHKLETGNFLQKLNEPKDLQNNHNKKLQNSCCYLHVAQSIVVLMIFETAINMTNVRKFSSEKNVAFCARKWQSASEY